MYPGNRVYYPNWFAHLQLLLIHSAGTQPEKLVTVVWYYNMWCWKTHDRLKQRRTTHSNRIFIRRHRIQSIKVWTKKKKFSLNNCSLIAIYTTLIYPRRLYTPRRNIVTYISRLYITLLLLTSFLFVTWLSAERTTTFHAHNTQNYVFLKSFSAEARNHFHGWISVGRTQR